MDPPVKNSISDHLIIENSILFIPFAFSILSSHCQKNQLGPMNSLLDKRSKRTKLRKESQEKAPEVLLKLLYETLKHCLLVSTIILASWFSFLSLVKQGTL